MRYSPVRHFAAAVLTVPLFDQFHLLVTVRTSCIAGACDRLAVAAFTVLADQHAGVLAFDREHTLAAVRAFCISQVIVTESSVGSLDILN